MRPPSYYTSLAQSNASNRNSSQQLRSTFSSSSSSSYVSRTHLPFVAQSTLVAHCFTGVQSSTRPYGASSVSSGYSSSSSLGGGGGGYSSGRSSYTSSSYSSRPASTKRPTSATPSPSYLTSASGYSYGSTARYTPTSSYRPTTSSSYYKPIRLRERPLLTQISRQINARPATSSSSSTTPSHSAARSRAESQVSAAELKSESPAERAKQSEPIEEAKEDEASWSADVARNISRNKYLIKFRELDKRHSLVTTAESEPKPPTDERPTERLERVVEPEPEPERAELLCAQGHQQELKMRLPKVEPEVAAPSELAERPKGEKTGAAEIEKTKPIEDCDRVESNTTKKPASTKKKAPGKRNIKLKIKTQVPVAVDAAAATTTTTATATTTATTTTTTTASAASTTPTTKASEPKVTESRKSETVAKSEAARASDQPPLPPVPTSPKIVKKKASGEKKPTETGSPSAKTKVKRLVRTSKTKTPPVESGEGAAKKPEGAAEQQPPKPPPRKPLAAKQQELPPLPPVPSKSSKPEAAAAQLPASDSSTPASATGNKRIRFREYNLEDFNFLSVLGHGGWGFVILAELKEHDACFAVKCIKKITIVEDDDFDSIMIERKVLALGNVHPFICKLFCTFETPGYLFFVMEYCAGGDLMFHVQHEGKFSESRCRFYAAEIICAIRFLHNRHIIYRDLKLDNILLDAQGHVRLVDFGMCQCRTYREEMLPSNFCGTPEYISPEIIKGVPYNHSVDWWSFGVLLYEMAVGKMPFRGSDENELLWNVCYEQIHYPMFLTKELTTLLQQLLEREPSKRMGMATCKAGDIYEQPWFRGVDWPAVETLRVPPPFVPEVTSKRDVQNFDSDFTESAAELSPVEASTLARIDQSQFQKFPYTNPDISIFG